MSDHDDDDFLLGFLIGSMPPSGGVFVFIVLACVLAWMVMR